MWVCVNEYSPLNMPFASFGFFACKKDFKKFSAAMKCYWFNESAQEQHTLTFGNEHTYVTSTY